MILTVRWVSLVLDQFLPNGVYQIGTLGRDGLRRVSRRICALKTK